MGLTALLLTVVFQSLVSHARIDRAIDKAHQVVATRQRLQEKLEALFTTVQPPHNKIPSFFVGKNQVQVLFDAGIDPDPVFSGKQLGTVWCNDKKQLCFTQRPIGREEERTEVLQDNVQTLEWQFLVQSKWLPQWPKNQPSFPSIIRLKVDGVEWAFILPGQEPLGLQ